jgi:hypothetical protein
MAWLDGWSKRFEYVIDKERIDQDLSTFPALIYVASGTGRNNFDTTDVFDELEDTYFSTDNFNPADKAAGILLLNNNLTVSGTVDDWDAVRHVNPVYSGKRYFEVLVQDMGAGTMVIGLGRAAETLTYPGDTVQGRGYHSSGLKYNSTSSAFGDSYGVGDIVGVAIDVGAQKIWFSKNGVWQDSGDPSTGQNPAFEGWTTFLPFYAMVGLRWIGQRVTANFGASTFQYTIPTGFLPYNLEYTDSHLKIAVTDSSGINQLPVEIEYWDFLNKKATLWTAVPTVASGYDTSIYLYYDKDHLENDVWVGVIGSPAAQKVWEDTGYDVVYHMAQPTYATQQLSSTGENHGSHTGFDGNELEYGDTGQSLYYNGSNDEAISLTRDYGNVYTIESYVRQDGGSDWPAVIGREGYLSYSHIAIGPGTKGQALFLGAGSWDGGYFYSNTALPTDEWYYAAVTNNAGNLIYYLNEDEDGSGFYSTRSVNTELHVGRRNDQPNAEYSWDGNIQELRIAFEIKSAAWLKASSYSVKDNLMTVISGGSPPPPTTDPPWQYDWANFLEVYVDKNKIDEDLGDFPVLVTLSSGTGKNSFDATPIFDHLEDDNGIDSYTSFMLPHEGDVSGNDHQFVFSNTPTITTLSGIACVSLDWSGTDYFNLLNSSDWVMNTDDFTLEMWIHPFASCWTRTNRTFAYCNISTTTGAWIAGLGYNAGWGSGLRMNFAHRTTGIQDITTNEITAPPTNQWYHIAFVRDGNTLKFYFDGNQVGSGAITNNLNASTGPYMRFGATDHSGSELFDGAIGPIRISKGIARYTGSTYTPPTTYTNDEYVKFLYYPTMEKSGNDHSMEMYQSVQLHTASPAFPNQSYWSFDGNDCIRVTDDPNFNFGSGDFTIEFWFNTTSFANYREQISKRASSGHYRWMITAVDAAGALTVAIADSASTWGYNTGALSVLSVGEWYHLAVTRENNTIRTFVDGLLLHTGTFTSAIYQDSTPLTIGAGASVGSYGHVGGIHGVKISKGVCKYTDRFIPSNPPEGTSWYNRKKIQFADKDHNRLYAEIDRWDHANKQAWLWTKIPAIADTIDTKFYLYYDKTQSDNSTWVGDTGERAATQVWNNAFSGVYHNKMKAMTGASPFMDSTSNFNDGATVNLNYRSIVLGKVAVQ